MNINLEKGKNLYMFCGDEKISWPLMVDGKMEEAETFWPKISLVTPSFNQGKFIEETIVSVLGQGYPNLEYIIMDGGSTDGSVDIIKKYNRYLKYWVSEPDRGQSHAINKGFNLASGEIIGWINSDDIFLPMALWKVGLFFKLFNINACSGNEVCMDVNSKTTAFKRFLPLDTKWLLAIGNFSQPTIFWKRELINVVGQLDENLYYAMDFEYFLRLSSVTNIYHMDEYLVAYRYHKGQKSSDKLTESRLQQDATISSPYISKLFGNYSEFLRYCNICRLKEILWYIRTRQFRRTIHPIKRLFRRNWRNYKPLNEKGISQ